jgi:hypothetical protein
MINGREKAEGKRSKRFEMKIEDLKACLKKVLGDRKEILFGYIHGSSLYSGNPKDIDLAVFLDPEKYDELARNGEQSINFAIPIEIELDVYLKIKSDLQILNKAPLSFRYTVVTHGEVFIDNDSNFRSFFEYLSRVEYFDFRARREVYLREVMT